MRPEVLTLLEVLVRYHDAREGKISLLPVRYCITDVERHLGQCTVAEFDTDKQKWYIEQLEKDGQSPGTIDRRLSVLIAALNAAVPKLLAKAPKVIRPEKVHSPGVRKFSTEEMRAVFAHARTQNERTMLLLWTTSICRPAQVLDLTWDRVDFEDRTIDYRVPGKNHKNKKRAKVMMPPTVQLWLKSLAQKDGPVITNMRIHDKRVPLTTFKNHIRRICERAGVKGSAYRIRKFGTSYLLNRGVAYIQVQEMLAHVESKITSRYYEADLPPVLRVLEELLAEIKPDWLTLGVARKMLAAKDRSLFSLVAANDPE